MFFDIVIVYFANPLIRHVPIYYFTKTVAALNILLEQVTKQTVATKIVTASFTANLESKLL